MVNKIETFQIEFILLIMDFKEGNVYLFWFRKNVHCEGTFVTYDSFNKPLFRNIIYGHSYHEYKDVKLNIYNQYNYKFFNACQFNNDTQIGTFDFNNYNYKFYDAEKVKNGQNAIKNMEKRSLDIVLKLIVNEHFEW
jgi:hypothetical protein